MASPCAENAPPYVPCRSFQRGFAHPGGGGSAHKPKREREFNEEHNVFINRVPPKLCGRAASLVVTSLAAAKALAKKATAQMVRIAGQGTAAARTQRARNTRVPSSP